MGKSAPPPTGYVAPGQAQPVPPGVANYNGPWADELKNKYAASNQSEGVFQQATEAQAAANRPTQNTPFGSSSWALDPTTGAWTQNTSLAPGTQSALQGMQGQLANAWNTPLDTGAEARTNAENAIYGREASRLDPRFAQGGQALDASLANSGLTPGDSSYDASKMNFERSKNDAYQQAQYGAITGGGAEASRQQAMDLQSRMAPLQGMAGLQQLLHMPGFQPGPNYLGAAMGASNYGLQANEQQNQQWADYWSGLAGLGGGAMRL